MDRVKESMTNAPSVLLFDLGGVIVDFRGAEGMRAAVSGAHSLEFCRDNWWRLPELDSLERGQIAPEAFADAFIRKWSLRMAPGAFVDAFKHWVVGLYDGAPENLAALRGPYRLACLSNVNAAHWSRCVELGVPAMFDAHFLSHEMGLRKPEPEIYRRVAADLGVAPADILFFDDVAANVDAARACGLQAVMVTAGDLRSALGAAGL